MQEARWLAASFWRDIRRFRFWKYRRTHFPTLDSNADSPDANNVNKFLFIALASSCNSSFLPYFLPSFLPTFIYLFFFVVVLVAFVMLVSIAEVVPADRYSFGRRRIGDFHFNRNGQVFSISTLAKRRKVSNHRLIPRHWTEPISC